EIANNTAFAPVLIQGSRYEDPSGKTGWSTPELPVDTTLYWHVRIGEADGSEIGPWSRVETFRSYLPPPPPPPVVSPPSPGPGPVGNWESCGSLTANKIALVQCVAAAVNPVGVTGAFEVTKRVAWLLRGEGGGLMIKNSGENIVSWRGYSF